MQTQSVIQASANVVRLISLKKGDVYKRIKKQYSDEYVTTYGIVTDILNDGENTFIESIEYKKNYSSVEALCVTHAGTQDLTIFPATIEEIKEYFSDVEKYIEKDIEKKEEELIKQRKILKDAKSFTSGQQQKMLSEATFSVMEPTKEISQ